MSFVASTAIVFLSSLNGVCEREVEGKGSGRKPGESGTLQLKGALEPGECGDFRQFM